jgi:16S rRNA C1402 (ribose-2'-O) methylase RsmI
VSLYRFYREITKLHDYLSNSKFDELKEELKIKCPEKGEMCAAVISEIEKIASDELIELLRLIEIVVAY